MRNELYKPAIIIIFTAVIISYQSEIGINHFHFQKTPILPATATFTQNLLMCRRLYSEQLTNAGVHLPSNQPVISLDKKIPK